MANSGALLSKWKLSLSQELITADRSMARLPLSMLRCGLTWACMHLVHTVTLLWPPVCSCPDADFSWRSAALNASEVNAVCWVLKLIPLSPSSVLHSGQGDPLFRKESWNLLIAGFFRSEIYGARDFPVDGAFITACWCLSPSLPSSLSLQGSFFHLINEHSWVKSFLGAVFWHQPSWNAFPTAQNQALGRQLCYHH